MKRQPPETVLQRFFETRGRSAPAQGEIEPVLDRVWLQLQLNAVEFVGEMKTPAQRAPSLRFVWAAGIVAAVFALLVNLVLWKERPPFPVADKAQDANRFMSMLSRQQALETLPVTIPEDAFEVASVKLLASSSEAATRAMTAEELQTALSGCTGGFSGSPQVVPGRLTISATTLRGLVIVAYGKDCTLVEGGPAWSRSGEYYEISALLPAGAPNYTTLDLQNGNAPRLQGMLQHLLARRFQLVLRRELREIPVYALTVSTRGKLGLSPDETLPFGPPGSQLQVARGRLGGGVGPTEARLFGHAISAAVLAKNLRQYAGRLVIDRTGLSDLFDCDVQFAWDGMSGRLSALPGIPVPNQATPPAIPPPPTPPLPSLGTALEEQLGFKLEATRMPIEVLVIESVNRPSEN